MTVVKSGTIASDLTTVGDTVLREAATRALDHGCGFVVYADPLDDGVQAN